MRSPLKSGLSNDLVKNGLPIAPAVEVRVG